MITVLHYAPGFKTGGIESRLLDWYRNIDRSKVRFVLIKLNNLDDTDNIAEFVKLGGTFYDLPPFSIKEAFTFPQAINKILKKEHVDIVHVHDVNSGIFVLKEAKKLGIKCRILHSRTTSYLPQERNVWIKTIFRKNAPRYANHFFACSVEAGIWGIGKKYKESTVVIKNGIQVDRFVYNEGNRNELRNSLGVSDKKVIGTVGRLSDQKNLPFLLEIFRKIIEIDNSYRLIIVGDGDRSILENYYKRYPISDYVIVTGNKKNVWDYYMAFDIFCGTSLYEGFGTTAIESQASGLPTIVSTNFPETVVVTDFIWRLPIDNSDIWVKKIFEMIGERYSEKGLIAVNEGGYNAALVAKDLQIFYCRNV